MTTIKDMNYEGLLGLALEAYREHKSASYALIREIADAVSSLPLREAREFAGAFGVAAVKPTRAAIGQATYDKIARRKSTYVRCQF